MTEPALTAPSWTRWEKHKHRGLVALVILASALIASAPRNERRLFAMPDVPMAFMAIPAPEPTSLRSAIMGYLSDGCGPDMGGGASGGRANSFDRIADADDCGRKRSRKRDQPVRAADPGVVPSAFFAMPDDPVEIDTSPLVDFAGLSPIPIDLPDVGAIRTFGTTPPRVLTSVPPALVSGVPEPTSWAMMIAGFGLAGFVLRRRPRLSLGYQG